MTREGANELIDKIMAGPEVPTGACRFCGEVPEKYRKHDQRSRAYWINIEGAVRKILGFIARFICSSCQTRFTEHPSYAIPRKLYVREEIERCNEIYLEQEQATLFETLRQRLFPEHEEPVAPSSESFMARSTVWRWTEWLGKQEDRASRMIDWIQRRDPRSPVAREVVSVAPHKWRSESRQEHLLTGKKLLRIQLIFDRMALSICSPRGATPALGP